MKIRELRSRLLEAGCVPVRVRGSHEIWLTPEGKTFPITRAHLNSDVTRFVAHTVRRVLPALAPAFR